MKIVSFEANLLRKSIGADMTSKPKLNEAAPKIAYRAGDRVIARLGSFPSREVVKKIKDSIDSYAGVELNSLVIDCSTVTLLLERGGVIQCLAGPKYLKTHQLGSNRTYSFGVSKFEIQSDDRFYVSTQITSSAVVDSILKRIKHWVGDCEMVHVPWKEFP
jgi:hypothetical protein